MRARPLFSIAVAAAILIGLPTVAYSGVIATSTITERLSSDRAHTPGTANQPAIGSGRRGQSPGPGASGLPGAPGVILPPGVPISPIDPGNPNPPGNPGGGGGGSGGSGCHVDSLLVPTCGLLWGVAAGAFTSTPTNVALHNWESATGHYADIYHVYHRGDELFPSAGDMAVANQAGHPHLLLINWKVAWGTTWANVAKGGEDARIDKEASYIKSHFTQKFFMAIHHEPENDVNESAGSGMTAKDYAAMFRHTVLRLRADGVHNAVFVLAYMGYEQWCEAPWFNDLWPGSDVVDWIGYDPYETAKPGAYAYGDFAKLVNGTHKPSIWPGFYSWATTEHPGKPVMLAEWGVFEYTPDLGQKAWIDSTVGSELSRFPALKAMVYFDSPNAPKGDTRVNSSAQALASFRALASLPQFNVDVSQGASAGLS